MTSLWAKQAGNNKMMRKVSVNNPRPHDRPRAETAGSVQAECAFMPLALAVFTQGKTNACFI